MKRLKSLLVLVLAVCVAGCAVKLGGRTVAETFDQPKVVDLIEAAMRGHANEVQRLAGAGADVNAIGHDGSTPLIWAMYANNLEGMEALLRAGADPNQASFGGVSALAWAAGSNKPRQLELLLRYGGNPNANDTGKIVDRPLSRAAAQGRMKNVQMLVAAGADVNAHDDHGNSAADQASAMGNFDIVAYFLEHGYSAELQSLASGVEIRAVPPDSDQQRWKDKVIVMLKQRGVKFPAFVPCYPPGDPRRKEENCKPLNKTDLKKGSA